MLHARGEDHDEQFLGNVALVNDDAAKFLKNKEKKDSAIEPRMGPIGEDADTGKDSGNESAEADSDSEDKKESIKAIQNALVGMNVSPQIIFLKYSQRMVFFIQLHGHCWAWII